MHGFKKLSQTKNQTVLQHANGHKLTVAHAALTDKMRRELDAIPMWFGGEAEKPEKPKPKATPSEPPIDKDKAKQVQEGFKKALGFADGGEAPELSQDQLSQIQQSIPEANPVTMSIDKGGPTRKFMSMDEEPPAPQPTNIPVPQQSQPQQMVTPDQAQNPTLGVDVQMGGLANEAAAQGALGTQQADIQKNSIDAMARLQEDIAKGMVDHDIEVQNLTHDIKNNLIDPKHYVSSMSAPEKVGTAIGMILSGLGGGATGGRNIALEYLQNNIKQDVEAQTHNANIRQNLLSALEQQYGNKRAAQNMLEATLTNKTIMQLQEAANRSQDPIARARAEQAIGPLLQQKQQLLQGVAMQQAMTKGIREGHIDPAQAVPMLVPKEHQKAVFGEIERAQNARENEANILKHFDEASKENTILKTGAGLLRTPASITNMQNLMMPVLKDNEGRINETEIKMMEQFAPRPGDTEAKIAAKRQGLQEFIRAKEATPTAKAFGIDLSPAPMTRRNPNIGK